MLFSLEQTLWLFLAYAFLGWCVEVAFHAVSTGRFINRGMANGPICPIYGFGVLLVLLLLEPVKDHFFLLFLGSVIVTTALEYLTGWALEKFFHDKWWDYSEEPFNLKGYVCLRFSLMWGLACLLVVRVIHPSVLFVVDLLCGNLPGRIVLGVLLALLVTDEVITFIQLAKLPGRLQAIENTQRRLQELSGTIGEPLTEHVLGAMEKLEDVREDLQEKRQELREDRAEREEQLRHLQAQLELYLNRRNRVQERLLKAFPALEKGRHGEAVAKLREKWESRKK